MTPTGTNRLLVGDVFRREALARPGRPAASLDGRVHTFADLDRGSNRLGHVLQGDGIGPGDRIAWWGDTSLDAVPLFAGLAKLGAAFAPMNARLGAAEVAPVVELARPAAPAGATRFPLCGPGSSRPTSPTTTFRPCARRTPARRRHRRSSSTRSGSRFRRPRRASSMGLPRPGPAPI